ncbi:MAG TPA: ATP-binding protein [Bacillota bacterium]|nr:ATP-binding protein [Bacillota bacterium]
MANLTDKINSEIVRVYEKRRHSAFAARDERISSLYGRYPSLRNFDERLRAEGFRRLQSALGQTQPESGAFDRVLRERQAFLAEHRIEEGYDQPAFYCHVCHDTGRVHNRWCFCRRQILQDILPAFFPDTMTADHTFAHFNLNRYDSAPSERLKSMSAREVMAGNLQAAQFYAAKFFSLKDRNLFFSGDPGTGKTFLMQCIGHRLMEDGASVIYITAPNLFDLSTRYKRLQQSFRPDPDQLEEAAMLYNAFITWDLLLIDDLGTEIATPETFAQLIAVLDTRQSRRLGTVIASNLKVPDFAKQYDRRIDSRLKGDFLIYSFPPGDLRQRRAEKSE